MNSRGGLWRHAAVPLVLLTVAAAMAVVLLPKRNAPAVPSDSSMSVPRPTSTAPAGNVVGPGGATTFAGFGYKPPVNSPTKDKPQSKLWYQDGSWWALMVNSATEQVHVFELHDNHAWRDTGAVVDERQLSTADAFWDEDRVWIASRTRDGQVRMICLRYEPTARSYSTEPGFPVVLSEDGASSVAMTRDGTGVLWATFVQGARVLVTNSTGPDGRRWTTPTAPPVPEAVATQDDISSLETMRGQVGLMWSNQRTGGFHFITHKDGAGSDAWSAVETPVQGRGMADGHVNLIATPDGAVYAAVKTSLDDVRGASGTAPLILVLERRPDGEWVQHVAGTVADGLTRPDLILNEEQGLLYLLVAAPSGGGRIFYKVSALDDMRWGPGRGTPLMAWEGARLNNVTGTKQSVTKRSGLVALASDETMLRYFHAEMTLNFSSEEPSPAP